MASLMVFLLMLALLIGVHEAGHWLAALASRVHIAEIGLGLPPRWARLGTWRGTAVTLNLLPLGGFVLPAGEFDRSQEHGFAAASPIRRAAILAAGPAANLLLGYLLFTLAFMLGAPDRVRIVAVEPDSPAAAAGLRAGDIVVTAGGARVSTAEDLRARVYRSLGRPLDLAIQRREEVVRMTLTPRLDRADEIRPAGFLSTGELVRYPFGASARRAAEQVGEVLRILLDTPRLTLAGQAGGHGVRLLGLVGMKSVSDRALDNALAWGEAFPLLQVAASLSIALGAINLLPVPALDGGRLMLLSPELIIGRRVDSSFERRLNAAGLVFLLAGMAILAVRDLMNPPL